MQIIIGWGFFIVWTLFYIKIYRLAKRHNYRQDYELSKRKKLEILENFNFLGSALLILLFNRDMAYKWDDRRKDALFFTSAYKVDHYLWGIEKRIYRDIFILLSFIGPLYILDPIFPIILLALVILRFYASNNKIKKKAKNIKKELDEELPNMLTQYILSIRSGSLPLNAWQEIAESNEGALYKEMRELSDRVRAGENMNNNFHSFGSRFEIEEIRKCGEIFAQGLESGAEMMADSLESLRSLILEKKSRDFKIKSARAEQEMIFPSLLLFLGIIILVLIPMLGVGN